MADRAHIWLLCPWDKGVSEQCCRRGNHSCFSRELSGVGTPLGWLHGDSLGTSQGGVVEEWGSGGRGLRVLTPQLLPCASRETVDFMSRVWFVLTDEKSQQLTSVEIWNIILEIPDLKS